MGGWERKSTVEKRDSVGAIEKYHANRWGVESRSMIIDWKESSIELPSESGYYLTMVPDGNRPFLDWFDGNEFFTDDNQDKGYIPFWWAEWNAPELTSKQKKEREESQKQFEKRQKQWQKDNDMVLSYNKMMKIIKKHLK
jgi:hypothetical protein